MGKFSINIRFTYMTISCRALSIGWIFCRPVLVCLDNAFSPQRIKFILRIFGAYTESGIGLEMGEEGFSLNLETKTVASPSNFRREIN